MMTNAGTQLFFYVKHRHRLFLWSLLCAFLVFCTLVKGALANDQNRVSDALPVKGVVGFAQDTLANDWRLMQVKEVERALATYPEVDFIVTDGKGSVALQAQQIRALAEQVDVLIISPRTEALLSTLISEIHAAGTPIILLDRGIKGDGYTSFVHGQNEAIGRQAGEFIAQALKGKGSVLMLEGVLGASATTQRTAGFMAVMTQYPDILVITQTANYLRADSIHVIRNLLEQDIAFDALFAQSDSMAEGARMALEQAGVNLASLPIVGVDYIQAAQDALLKGHQSLSLTYPTGGKEGAELAIRVLRGESVPKRVEIPFIRVTPANAADVEPIF